MQQVQISREYNKILIQLFESNDRKKNIESYAFNDFFIKSASAIKNLVL